ncbi:NAD(P)-dependent oxidoreductase [Amycolatopsis sp. NPDC001319]|uniref:NAD(P)-dependent oxidoreductase n=1 Tax=unclassified Amycolatopsis TaxID=2618356 RepID=UPI003699E387
MRIAVFGGTGMAGRAVVTEALTRGHTVTAVARRPPAPDHGRLSVLALDVGRTEDLAPVLTAADAAVLAVRLAPGREHLLAPLTHGFLDAAQRCGTRVLVVGGSAPLRSPDDAGRLVIDDPAYVPAEWKTIAQASLDQFRVCRDHPHDAWTYLSPPAILEPGTHTGGYRRGRTTLLTDGTGDSRISAPDLALAVLDELENPRGEHHFTVARSLAE